MNTDQRSVEVQRKEIDRLASARKSAFNRVRRALRSYDEAHEDAGSNDPVHEPLIGKHGLEATVLQGNRIPRADEHRVEGRTQKPGLTGRGSVLPRRILVVEPDPEARDAMRSALVQAGFVTEVCASPGQAWRCAGVFLPSMVLASTHVLSNREVQALRCAVKGNPLSVYIYSRHADHILSSRCAYIGADGFIKQTRYEELPHVLKDLMEARAKRQDSVLPDEREHRI